MRLNELLENYDRPMDQRMDQWTDGLINRLGHREVSLRIINRRKSLLLPADIHRISTRGTRNFVRAFILFWNLLRIYGIIKLCNAICSKQEVYVKG